MKLRCANLFLLLCISQAASADWVNPSVSFQCDSKHQKFSLVGVVDTDNDGTVPLLNGFHQVERNTKPAVACKIGAVTISAKFKLLPAHEHGQCSAFDTYLIESLAIGGRKLLKYELFNNVCNISDPALYRIEISGTDVGLMMNECRGKWDWTQGYNNGTCHVRALSEK